MKNLKIEKKGRGLLVVAHPDDETIWSGGVILRHPQINWTIFSLCRLNDPDRRPKFLRTCKFYKAKPIISALEDENIMSVASSIPAIEKRLLDALKNQKFTYLFTHGSNGEYGHFRHLGVHRAIKKLLKQKKLGSPQVFYFCYQGKNKGAHSHCLNALKKAKYALKLTPKELETKRKIIHKLYGFSKKSFEYLSCLKQETFC